MPGFYISNLYYKPYNYPASDRFVQEKIEHNTFSIYRYTLSKFLGDKLFCEDESVITILEGVILNSSSICKPSLFECVKNGFLNGERFYNSFRGNFSGAVYNKEKHYWEVFTDFLGMKPVFYYSNEDKWIVSSDLTEVISTLKELHLEYSLNTEAAYDLLTYGYMIGDNTLINEIKKLPYGCYLRIANNEIKVVRYYDFEYCSSDVESELTDEQIIESMDALFRKAITAQFEKDAEYGYDHLATLSGGLDSRMTVWVAHTLGYKNITNLTFGQSDCYDEKVAKQVANKLGHSMIIRTLNDGKMLSLYKDVVRLNGGLSLYSGIAHSLIALSSINSQRYGILHTGDVGDAIIGSFTHGTENDYPGAYSLKLTKRVTHKWDKSVYVEKFKMMARGFNGVGSSKIVCENYLDCMSPFLYRDFFEYCLREIPFSKRNNHYIYKKWVLAKYPEAAQIPLQRYNGGLMTEGKMMQSLRKIHRIGIKTVVEWVLWKCGIKKELSRRIVKSSMNPLDFWYESNHSIAETMDSYVYYNEERVRLHTTIKSELIDDAIMLYNNGNTSEKTQVITLFAFIEDWFLSI